MTKKDYQKFADIIAEIQKSGRSDIALYQLNDKFQKIFKEDNPNFSCKKWDEYIEKKIKQG